MTLMAKNPPANAGDKRDVGLILGLGRFPGGGHDNLLQYSCLKNPMDRGARRARIHRVTKSRDFARTHAPANNFTTGIVLTTRIQWLYGVPFAFHLVSVSLLSIIA